MAVRAHRWTGVVNWISATLIVIALFVIIRALLVDQAIDLLKSKVDGLGFWGPLALGAAYVVAALAFRIGVDAHGGGRVRAGVGHSDGVACFHNCRRAHVARGATTCAVAISRSL